MHNDSCCSQFVWSLSLSDSTHVAETLHTDVRRERDDGKNRVLPNDASYNSDTCSAIFFIFMVFCICVFSYHVSRSYSVSLSPVVLTTSLPLFICCPENTVDSAFVASVRLEEWLLLLYGRERRCFLLPSSMYWRIWINQALVAGLLSPIWGLYHPFLLFVLEPKGQVSAPSLWTAPMYVLRYFSSTTAQRTWGGQKKETLKTTKHQPVVEGSLAHLMNRFFRTVGLDELVLRTIQWFFHRITCSMFVFCKTLQYKIPVKLAGFHRQALLAWILVYV